MKIRNIIEHFTLSNLILTASIATLLLLSNSIVRGIICPGTKPVYGTQTTNVIGPDLQQQQQ